MPLTQAELIWRDAQIDVDAVSHSSEEDAVRWIEKTILPGAVAYVDGQLQQISLPYSYPLAVTALAKAYPSMAVHSLQKILDGWEAQRQEAIKYKALCSVFSLIDTTKEEWVKRGERFCTLAEKAMLTLQANITKVLDRLPDSETGGKFGLLVLKLPDRKFGENDYALEP